MIDKNPFSYDSWADITWAIGLAIFGGLVKYLNNNEKFRFSTFIRDLVTAGFCGLLTFWLCEWMNIKGPLTAILISASGLMGTRLLKEIENFYRIRMGLEPRSAFETMADQQSEADMKAIKARSTPGASGE